MTDLQIRPMDADDSFEELTELLHRAYASLGVMGFNYTAVDQSVEVTRRRAATGECYVGLVAEQIIGTLVLVPPGLRQTHCEWYARPGVWVISQFGVEPEFQGLGIGGLMMTFAERRAAQLGAIETAVDTAAGAAHLIALYAKRGYRQVDHVQWQGKTYRSVVLSKRIEE
jgi:GNAT superfamily N-acetyltransferase